MCCGKSNIYQRFINPPCSRCGKPVDRVMNRVDGKLVFKFQCKKCQLAGYVGDNSGQEN